MSSKKWFGALAVVAVAIVILAIAVSLATPPGGVATKEPKLEPGLADLLSAPAASPAPGFGAEEDLVLVEVLHDVGARSGLFPRASAIRGTVGETLTEALVTFDELQALRTDGRVVYVREPLVVNQPDGAMRRQPGLTAAADVGVQGDESVVKTNASTWHAAGWTGRGISIGIIDLFSGAPWTAAAGAGELPSSAAGTFCRTNGVDCDIWTGNQDHGVAVAEIIHDQAPEARIYLAEATSTSDLQAAVDWFAAQGVRIITRSLTASYDGPGDGTGPIADVMQSAVSKGIAWFNSAGNNGGTVSRSGSYFRHTWIDSNSDGWMDFPSGGTRLAFTCYFVNGLRWSDWENGAVGATDYDLVIYDDATSDLPESVAEAPQGTGQPPLEHPRCGPAGDVDHLAIKRYAAGSDDAGDVLEFMTNGGPVTGWSNPFSASGPAADTRIPGTVSVGAIDPVDGVVIAPYSAQGPTNDGRLKPDISAASNMSSSTSGKFDGTSAATPVAAGAAALVLQSSPSLTPQALMDWLLTNAMVERGDVGADNVYGRGELVLPAP